MSTDVTTAQEAEQPELKRALGPKLLLLFIVGDILGTGVYALTGDVAAEVGGAAWAPFLVAFAVATLTAFSYLELVTKYPQAAGAALYTHKAFGIHFLTFLVAFAVMSSGITSASTASKFFAENLAVVFGIEAGTTAVMVIAMAFMVLLAIVNLRGVSESVKVNVVLTLVELTGLLIVILIGFYAMTQGQVDFSRVVVFETSGERSAFVALTAATSLAFFAMVGFEDSVNMAEETHDPSRTFPKVMLTGLGLTAFVYVLVSVAAVAVVPVGVLSESETPLLEVVQAGAPGLPMDTLYPLISMFAVANTALINMLMASRLIYGMAKQDVLPRSLADGPAQAAYALGGDRLRDPHRAGTDRRRHPADGGGHGGGARRHHRAPAARSLHAREHRLPRAQADPSRAATSTSGHPCGSPCSARSTCAFLVGPWTDRDPVQYQIAGVLIALGVVLWVFTWLWNRGARAKRTGFRDVDDISR